MAFADAVQRMLDAQYRTMGVEVLWTPAGGVQLTLLGLARLGEEIGQIDGLGDMNVRPMTVRLRTAEVTALAGAVDPGRGDLIQIAGEALVIQGDPRRTGNRRLEWTCELAPG